MASAASAASPWLLARDESIQDKLKDLIGKDPLGATVRAATLAAAYWPSS
jgi:hypothetical protein